MKTVEHVLVHGAERRPNLEGMGATISRYEDVVGKQSKTF